MECHNTTGQCLFPAHMRVIAHISECPGQVTDDTRRQNNTHVTCVGIYILREGNIFLNLVFRCRSIVCGNIYDAAFIDWQFINCSIAVRLIGCRCLEGYFSFGNFTRCRQNGGINIHIDGCPFVRLKRYIFGLYLHRLTLQVACCLQRNMNRSSSIRTVHHAESGTECVTLTHLIGHHRAHFCWPVNLECSFTQSQTVPGRCSQRQNPPAGQVIRGFKLNTCRPLLVHRNRWVPIADIFEQGAHIDISATVTTGISPLFLKLLTSDKSAHQAIIAKIQTIEAIKPLVRIKSQSAIRNQVEYGFVQYGYCYFRRLRFFCRRFRHSHKINAYFIAWTIDLLRDRHIDLHLLDRVFHRHSHITHAEGRLTKIDLPLFRWRGFHAWGYGHH